MTSPIPVYRQGDIVVVDFPFTDVSQTKKRPALVLSNRTINQAADYLLVMIASQVKYDGLSLPITSVDYIGGPLPLTSYVRFHKIFLLNESLISHRYSTVTAIFWQTVANALTNLIQSL